MEVLAHQAKGRRMPGIPVPMQVRFVRRYRSWCLLIERTCMYDSRECHAPHLFIDDALQAKAYSFLSTARSGTAHCAVLSVKSMGRRRRSRNPWARTSVCSPRSTSKPCGNSSMIRAMAARYLGEALNMRRASSGSPHAHENVRALLTLPNPHDRDSDTHQLATSCRQ